MLAGGRNPRPSLGLSSQPGFWVPPGVHNLQGLGKGCCSGNKEGGATKERKERGGGGRTRGAGGRTRGASETKKICTSLGWAVAGEAAPGQRLPLLAPPLPWSPWQRGH